MLLRVFVLQKNWQKNSVQHQKHWLILLCLKLLFLSIVQHSPAFMHNQHLRKSWSMTLLNKVYLIMSYYAIGETKFVLNILCLSFKTNTNIKKMKSIKWDESSWKPLLSISTQFGIDCKQNVEPKHSLFTGRQSADRTGKRAKIKH